MAHQLSKQCGAMARIQTNDSILSPYLPPESEEYAYTLDSKNGSDPIFMRVFLSSILSYFECSIDINNSSRAEQLDFILSKGVVNMLSLCVRSMGRSIFDS